MKLTYKTNPMLMVKTKKKIKIEYQMINLKKKISEKNQP